MDRFAEIYGNPEVMKFVGDYRPRSREETLQRKLRSLDHYRLHGFGMWAVVERGSARVIGRCGLEFRGPDVDIGWLLDRPWWGMGLATEAAVATLNHGFNKLALERILAMAIPENSGSIRIMEKLGMSPLDQVDVNGSMMVRYVVTRTDYLRGSA